MKRLKFHRAIVAIAMMLIGWLPSLAHDFEVNGIFYDKINSSTVEVTYKGSSHYEFYDEYNGSVVIPSLVEYGGFTYSVTSIGEGAFMECSSLTSVEIGNSVTSIGNYAFYSCESLTSIEIPNSVTSIGTCVFSDCNSLTSIEIPNSVTSIGNSAFSKCSSLTSIEIPNSVTSIGNRAFEDCTSLTSIEIPNSVTSIGNRAFEDCTSLTSIVVDAGNSIYDSRNGCNAIIETASNTLIAGCQNTIIPNSVTSIGNYAFYSCESLTSIEIPNSVTSIGDEAFKYCSGLISIEIPNSVTSIGNSAFLGCSSLTSIVVDAGNTKYDSRNECNAIIETASNTLIVGCKNTIIPNSVTSIGNYAFYGCYDLTGIEIPNSVTSIGDEAFKYCSGLISIEIPNSVTSIGNSAFSNCSSLTRVVIGNSVTSIGNSAFSNCSSLTRVVIGNSVTSIGDEAFHFCTSLISIEIPNSVTSIGYEAFYRCYSLTEIKCWATTPPTIESDTFSEYSAFLFVPIGCKAAYEVADYWVNFNNIFEVPLGKPITLNDNDAIVATIGENIVVKNAKLGSVINVYASNGALVASEEATDGSVVVEVPVKGVYVVTVGKQTVKVII